MLLNALYDILDQNQVLLNEPMRQHTSFKIGGNVKILVIPSTVEQITKTIALCKAMAQPYFIMNQWLEYFS